MIVGFEVFDGVLRADRVPDVVQLFRRLVVPKCPVESGDAVQYEECAMDHEGGLVHHLVVEADLPDDASDLDDRDQQYKTVHDLGPNHEIQPKLLSLLVHSCAVEVERIRIEVGVRKCTQVVVVNELQVDERTDRAADLRDEHQKPESEERDIDPLRHLFLIIKVWHCAAAFEVHREEEPVGDCQKDDRQSHQGCVRHAPIVSLRPLALKDALLE